MSAEIFLIVPPEPGADAILPPLTEALGRTPVSALLLRRGELAENAYKQRVKALAPLAQEAGAAVLIEGEPGLVRTLAVDGLHVGGAVAEVRDAAKALKPDFIVGAVCDGTRHDAMAKGELEVDYIFFGPFSGATTAETREVARWWAETMEIPSVLSDPASGPDSFDAEGCEFAGITLAVPGTPT